MMKKLMSLLLCAVLCLACIPGVAEEALTLTENIYDFRAAIDGVVYQLPMKAQELLDNGWSFKDAGETLQPNNYTISSIEMVKGTATFDVALYNPDIVTQPYENCYVIKFRFDPSPYNASAPQVEFAKGITMESSAEEIIAAYGVPNDLYDKDPAYYMTYKYDIQQEFCADFYEKKLTEMELYNFTDEMPGAVRSAYDDTATEVFGRYAAHEDDGTLFGHSFTVDGVSYQLLTPIQALLDNGWTVKDVNTYLDDDYIAADASCRVKLFKDNQTLEVYVKNYDQDRAAKLAYCFVTEVTFDSYDMENMKASVPGFYLGMTKDEVTAALEGFAYVDVNESSYSTSYRISQFEDGSDYLTMYLNNEKGIVTELNVDYRPRADELPF